MCASASASPTLPCAQKTRCSSVKLFPMGQRDAATKMVHADMRSLVSKCANRPRADILSEQSQIEADAAGATFWRDISHFFATARPATRQTSATRDAHATRSRAHSSPDGGHACVGILVPSASREPKSHAVARASRIEDAAVQRAFSNRRGRRITSRCRPAVKPQRTRARSRDVAWVCDAKALDVKAAVKRRASALEGHRSDATGKR